LNTLEKQVNENMRIKEILKHLADNLLAFDDNLRKLKGKFIELERQVPETVRILSSIITQFMITKDNLIEIGRKWKRKIVSETLLDMFNFTLECNDHCPIEKATALYT